MRLAKDEADLSFSRNIDDLCETSNQIIRLIGRIQSSMQKYDIDTIYNEIASQQLEYFMYEWNENYLPAITQIYSSVENLDEDHSPSREPRRSNTGVNQKENLDIDALKRLQTSMSENEKLISIIASTTEETRRTVASVYDSIQSAMINMDIGGDNVQQTIAIHKSNIKFRSICYFVIFCIVVLLIIGTLRLFYII